ncbi:hypothetical protein [Kitasatospora sp. NPDC058478]
MHLRATTRKLLLTGLALAFGAAPLLAVPAQATTASAVALAPVSAAASVARPSAPIAVSTALFALAPDRGAVFNWNGATWTQVGGPAATIVSGGGGLVATSPATGDLYAYNWSPDN